MRPIAVPIRLLRLRIRVTLDHGLFDAIAVCDTDSWSMPATRVAFSESTLILTRSMPVMMCSTCRPVGLSESADYNIHYCCRWRFERSAPKPSEHDSTACSAAAFAKLRIGLSGTANSEGSRPHSCPPSELAKLDSVQQKRSPDRLCIWDNGYHRSSASVWSCFACQDTAH